MTTYFMSQVGKMVPEHQHDFQPRKIVKSTGLTDSANEVLFCTVCGQSKQAVLRVQDTRIR